ncbi:MAG: AgmX/PglI C-terminal domain-containing protein [Steroidobacteraceae bacterium]
MEEFRQQEEDIRERAATVRQALQELETGLQSVDGKLAELAPAREQHALLGTACSSLDRLEELGAASLFWDGVVAPAQVESLLGSARQRASAFNLRIDELDTERRSLTAAMAEHQESLEYLGEELYQLREQEERRKLEWIEEREISEVPARVVPMPWYRGGEDDRRLRKSLVTALAASLLCAAVLPLIDLPLPEPFEPDDVPERLVQLVRKELPKPPPMVAETTPEEIKRRERPQEVPPVPEPEAIVAEATPDQVSDVPNSAKPGPAQKQVEKAGILAFKDRFAGLASDDPTPKLAKGARFRGAAESATEPAARALLTSHSAGSSGGINLASLSRNVGGGGDGGVGGGGGMQGVAIGRATSAIAAAGGGGGGASSRSSGGAGLSRTDEEIQIVFDRYKASFYRLYSRELRKDPTLRGQMVLRLTIEPDGSVSMCELYDSEMDAPVLAGQVVDRVRGIDFGAKEGVQALTIVYPIDFLPAA